MAVLARSRRTSRIEGMPGRETNQVRNRFQSEFHKWEGRQSARVLHQDVAQLVVESVKP